MLVHSFCVSSWQICLLVFFFFFVCFVYTSVIKFKLGLLKIWAVSRQREPLAYFDLIDPLSRHLSLNKECSMGYSTVDWHALGFMLKLQHGMSINWFTFYFLCIYVFCWNTGVFLSSFNHFPTINQIYPYGNSVPQTLVDIDTRSMFRHYYGIYRERSSVNMLIIKVLLLNQQKG